MLKTVLCADIGTTSLKAGLFTADGEAVFLCRKSFSNPDDRYIANDWLLALQHCIKKMHSQYDFYDGDIAISGRESLSAERKIKSSSTYSSPAEKKAVLVCGICISGAGPTVVLENGLTFRWNENLSAVAQMPSEVARSLFLPRILELKNRFFDDYTASSLILSAPEFLIYKLTDVSLTILPEARFEAAYWNKKTCGQVAVDFEKLPAFIGVGAKSGVLTPSVAATLNLPAGIPVFTGAPDFVVALIGTNTLQAGRLCDRAGSSEGFNFCTDTPFFTPATRTLPSVIPCLWNVSVLSTESGRIFVEYKHALEKKLGKTLEYAALVEEIVKNPDSEGFRILQSILAQVKKSVEVLKSALREENIPIPASMTVTGGQAKNDLWMQKKADALGMTLEICNCADSELTGDACAAWFGLGLYKSLQDAAEKIVKVTKRFTPNENL